MEISLTKQQIINFALTAGLEAAKILIKHYLVLHHDDIEQKSDGSPVTIADKESDIKIHELLAPSGIYVLSEETKATDDRFQQKCIWSVDPLDGTKEFIKRNGEFSVNIALVINSVPYFGLIMAPMKGLICYGFSDELPLLANVPTIEFNSIQVDQVLKNSFRISSPSKSKSELISIGSRSHSDPKEKEHLLEFIGNKTIVSSIQVGSALKFISMINGEADIYVRSSPTMEWDTAAGHALILGCGGEILNLKTKAPLKYNKVDLLNPGFVALLNVCPM